jgi:orotidine-5'-phosphate decarboxylase
VQGARTRGGTVADVVLDHLRHLNAGAEPLGSFGAVVGATIEGGEHDLDINGPVLAPGYGAQGGTVADLRRIFGAGVGRVLPASARELLRAGPAGLADAADRLNEELRGLGG